MGTIHIGTASEHLPDNDLALLRAVAAVKIKQNEPFLASFVNDRSVTAHWLSRTSRLRFEFDTPGAHPVDGWHLDLQLAEAASVEGVRLQAS